MAQRVHDLGVDLERRRISVWTALALLGGATVTLSGCGGGGGAPGAATPPTAGPPAPPAAPSCPTGSRCGVVIGDGRHSAVITGAQLTGGGALELDIQGSAPHGHFVSLSAADVATIRDGRSVLKTSSESVGHSHDVIFN